MQHSSVKQHQCMFYYVGYYTADYWQHNNYYHNYYYYVHNNNYYIILKLGTPMCYSYMNDLLLLLQRCCSGPCKDIVVGPDTSRH